MGRKRTRKISKFRVATVSTWDESGREIKKKIDFTAKELYEAYHGLQDDNTTTREDDGTGNCGAGEALQSQRGAPFIEEEPVEEPVEEPEAEPPFYTFHKKRKITEAAGWKNIQEDLMKCRIEGFSPAKMQCCFCGSTPQEVIWCPDCGPSSLYCHKCDSEIHRVVLYHHSFVWDDEKSVFVHQPRRQQLVRDDHECATVYNRLLTVFDVQGRHHTASISFCRCEPESLTLVRLGLWPATPKNPTTAFTIALMELCRAMQLEGQLSIQKVCKALEIQETFLPRLVDGYVNLSRAIGDSLAEFRHHQLSCLEVMKSPHMLGKKCPICTQKPEDSVVSMDANFGLVHKQHSGSGPGLEYVRMQGMFCDDAEVKQFVNTAPFSKGQTEDCSDFQAGTALRSKNKTKKLDVTGVFGSVCQHGFPLFFLNMEHGERFCYPVFVLQQIARNWNLAAKHKRVTIMYDVACSLQAHLKKNAEKYRELTGVFHLVVPIFHSFAHNMKCQLTYGQRYAEGTGMVDGEGMERLWSYLRRFAGMTKEMTLPNRQDFLTCALLNFARRNFGTIAERLAGHLKKSRAVQEEAMKIINTECTSDERSAALYLEDLRKISSTKNSGSSPDSLISKAQKLASERQHLQGLMKKYADGQKIASRLTKKLQQNSSNLRAIAESLRGLGQTVTIAELSDVQSPVYNNTGNCSLTASQVKAAQAYADLSRAREEEERVHCDVKGYYDWLLNTNASIAQELELSSLQSSRYQRSLAHLITISKLAADKQLQGLVALFPQYSFSGPSALNVNGLEQPSWQAEAVFEVEHLSDSSSDSSDDE